MTDAVVFVSHFAIKEGSLAALKQYAPQTAQGLEEDKPRTSMFVAYISDDGAHERLVLADISKPNPDERIIASVRSAADLGRPTLRGDRLAWHRIVHGGSAIYVLNLATHDRRAIKRTNVWMEANPSVTSRRIVWVEHRPQGSYLRMKWFGSKQTKTLMHVSGRKTLLWTTALTGRTAYVTKWTPSTQKAVVLRVNF